MTNSFAPWWTATGACFVLFPIAAVPIVRRLGRVALALQWLSCAGGLFLYGTRFFEGDRDPWFASILVTAVPLAAAAFAVGRSVTDRPIFAMLKAWAATVGLFLPSAAFGLWWAIETCQGGCL